MEVKELGHVVLYVRDVEVSRRFYGEVLGWKELTHVPGQVAVFSSGRTNHELLLIQVGAAETLLDDALRLAAIAGAADVWVDLQIWPQMIHVWHLFHPELEMGRQAIRAGGYFVKAQVNR